MKIEAVFLPFALFAAMTLHGLSQRAPDAPPAMKSWHSPYDEQKMSSRFFLVLPWEEAARLRRGMPVAELKKLAPILNPYGNADALIYSDTPEKIRYEIELKFSPPGVVADISFRRIEVRPSSPLANQEKSYQTKSPDAK